MKDLSNDKSIAALKLLVETIKESHDLSSSELFDIISVEKDSVPLSVFSNSKLSALELIVKYLKEELALSYHEIAKKLNRNDRTIWTTYNNSLKKSRHRLKYTQTGQAVPLSIFYDRKLSVLESLVKYMKDLGMSFRQISQSLKKDYQTIYTTYRRALSKNEK